jgi:hypothetical protein
MRVATKTINRRELNAMSIDEQNNFLLSIRDEWDKLHGPGTFEAETYQGDVICYYNVEDRTNDGSGIHLYGDRQRYASRMVVDEHGNTFIEEMKPAFQPSVVVGVCNFSDGRSIGVPVTLGKAQLDAIYHAKVALANLGDTYLHEGEWVSRVDPAKDPAIEPRLRSLNVLEKLVPSKGVPLSPADRGATIDATGTTAHNCRSVPTEPWAL